MSYKINNVYYLTYVYRFCSQFCSQNNFRDFKLEPMTIRKIHMCSYINWALCFSSFDVIFFSSRVSVCCRTFRYVPLLPLSHGCLCTDLFDGYQITKFFQKNTETYVSISLRIYHCWFSCLNFIVVSLYLSTPKHYIDRNHCFQLLLQSHLLLNLFLYQIC